MNTWKLFDCILRSLRISCIFLQYVYFFTAFQFILQQQFLLYSEPLRQLHSEELNLLLPQVLPLTLLQVQVQVLVAGIIERPVHQARTIRRPGGHSKTTILRGTTEQSTFTWEALKVVVAFLL